MMYKEKDKSQDDGKKKLSQKGLNGSLCISIFSWDLKFFFFFVFLTYFILVEKKKRGFQPLFKVFNGIIDNNK